MAATSIAQELGGRNAELQGLRDLAVRDPLSEHIKAGCIRGSGDAGLLLRAERALDEGVCQFWRLSWPHVSCMASGLDVHARYCLVPNVIIPLQAIAHRLAQV